jgi:hypothetical protein
MVIAMWRRRRYGKVTPVAGFSAISLSLTAAANALSLTAAANAMWT